MRDKFQKKEQRKINHAVRVLNKNIENDSLWRGRFYGYQFISNWYRFYDNSGGVLNVGLRFVDKKTGQTKNIYIDNYNIYYGLWQAMNSFIVEDCAVWKNDNPFQDNTDYRKVE